MRCLRRDRRDEPSGGSGLWGMSGLLLRPARSCEAAAAAAAALFGPNCGMRTAPDGPTVGDADWKVALLPAFRSEIPHWIANRWRRERSSRPKLPIPCSLSFTCGKGEGAVVSTCMQLVIHLYQRERH